MSLPEPVLPAPASTWRWRLLAGFLILAAAALHIAYLACDCPLDLACDEAHYRDWARQLDWSYYSKGPLVAYLIRGGCLLAGSWSQQLTGSEMLAVRLPAVVCGSLLLLSLYVLTVQVFGREGLATAVVGLALTLPIIAVGSSLMTIDAPLACCWGWALVLGQRAVFRGSRWAWPLAGLAIGLGILAKYTMVLFVPSLGLFLLTSPAHRRLLFRPGFWVLTGVAVACCFPIIWWNVQHDWVSLKHVLGLGGFREGHSDGPSIHWLGPLNYLGAQCGLLLVFWFIAWVTAMIAHRPWVESDAGARYLWWMSAPMFVFFLLFSLKTGGGEPNWPVMAYLSGMVLAGGRLARQLRSPYFRLRRLTIASLAAVCVFGLTTTVLIHHSEWVFPLLTYLAGSPTEQCMLPIRRVDPTCRLRGWRTLAAEVDRIRNELRHDRRIDPVLAGTGWTLPGELAFYCEGRPTVYSIGLALGDRWSQYDFWHPNPLSDAESFAGKTFIVVGGLPPQLTRAFDEIEPPRIVWHHECGQPVAFWVVTVCHRFHGLEVPSDLKHY